MKTVLTAALIAGLCGGAFAASAESPGEYAYKTRCVSCHGADAKGHGPLAEYLKAPPSDLTLLARKNGGVFPYLHVSSMIDGRDMVKLHGERNMPVWGAEFVREVSRPVGWSPVDPESSARDSIVALMEYLDRIQQK